MAPVDLDGAREFRCPNSSEKPHRGRVPRQVCRSLRPILTGAVTRGDRALGNDGGWPWLAHMSNVEIAKPLTRAINIYRKMVRHDLDRQTCRAVARHIKALADQGLEDPGRLTVHGLSYLRKLDRQTGER
jgi:hypothetical protein